MRIGRWHYCVCFALITPGFGTPANAGESLSAGAAAAEELSAAVDLRPRLEKWGLGPRQQGQRPTCSVFAFAGALEFAVANERQRGERLSVEFLNWAANQTRRHVRDGGFFSEMWDGFAAHGICAEKQMPYAVEFDPARVPGPDVRADAKKMLEFRLVLHWIKKWNVHTGLSGDEVSRIKATLNRGWPVCGGLRWPKQEKWKDDVLQVCPPEEVFDGHSVLLVGYRDDVAHPGGGVFIFRNTNRRGRDGFMPYAYAQAFMNDAAWIDSKGTNKSAGIVPEIGVHD